MKREYTSDSFVRIDGVYVPFDSVEPEMRKTILTELNIRAMRAAGYEVVKDGKTA